MVQSFFDRKTIQDGRKAQVIRKITEDQLALSKASKLFLLPDFNKRFKEFDKALDQADKELALKHYKLFIDTLDRCAKEPKKVDSHISSYFNSPDYYTVGITETLAPDLKHKKIVRRMFYLGIVLGLSSIPLFVFKPGVAAVLLICAFLFAVPKIIDYFSSEPLNKEPMHDFEEHLFEELSNLHQFANELRAVETDFECPTP